MITTVVKVVLYENVKMSHGANLLRPSIKNPPQITVYSMNGDILYVTHLEPSITLGLLSQFR